MHIDREDMLELTRRMTVSRSCFSRIAGAYMDEEGFIDGTFNTHFLKLSGSEKEKNLNIAKTVPYSNTNVNLKNYRLDLGARRPGGVIQLLEALRQCELKNDALLYSSYYKVVVFIDPLQGLYAILLEILWIVFLLLPLDGF